MRKLLTIFLISSLFILASGGQVFPQTPSKNEALPAEKIKAKLAKLGIGEKARAEIKLRTGEKIKGHVASAGENDFAFTERKTGHTKTILYSDVAEVKKSGGLSTAAKIGIGLGIGVAVLAVVAIHIKNHLFDDFTLGQR